MVSMRLYKYLFIFLAVIACNPNSFAQEGLSKEAYDELREDYDYSDIEPKPEREERQRPIEELEVDPPTSSWFTRNAWLSTALAVLVILVVVYLIWLYQQRMDNAKVSELKAATSVEHAEQDLLNVSLDELLEEASAEQDLRMLVHLNFLELLRSLHNQNHISWEPYKTNGQYLLEIVNDTVRQGYAETVVVFDRVWYGHKPINSVGFDQWMNRVKSLQNEK
ncbi:DUF4129 domain-containing protein [Phaeocystidibacter luteus]|uniref:DUF4129 domain-containing protein n=2 Tax=Phaeocystidibacter luteus TaxID=911197 RepID=A0A6N6RLC4_9FLAO|nr:DUF4129 domain-containing protein [Phaeocystidibacter luteus]